MQKHPETKKRRCHLAAPFVHPRTNHRTEWNMSKLPPAELKPPGKPFVEKAPVPCKLCEEWALSVWSIQFYVSSGLCQRIYQDSGIPIPIARGSNGDWWSGSSPGSRSSCVCAFPEMLCHLQWHICRALADTVAGPRRTSFLTGFSIESCDTWSFFMKFVVDFHQHGQYIIPPGYCQ